MDVHVHKTGADGEARGIEHLDAGARTGAANIDDSAVFHQNIHYAADRPRESTRLPCRMTLHYRLLRVLFRKRDEITPPLSAANIFEVSNAALNMTGAAARRNKIKSKDSEIKSGRCVVEQIMRI
jgi:hypothetical protein